MARNRVPGGISSIEFRAFVKDPDAATTALFSRWVQIPGVGGVTLPAEEAPSTDELMLEGVAQATGFSAPGTVAIPLPRLTQHPAHRLLMDKHESGEKVLIKLSRRASKVASIAGAGTGNTITGALAASGTSTITGAGTVSFAAILPGHYTLIDTTAPADAYETLAATNTSGADEWRAVVAVTDEKNIVVSPGAAAVAAAAHTLYVRQPGLLYTDVTCTVGTMARGEAAGSASVAGNLVLRPDTALGAPSIVLSTTDLAAVHA